MEENKMKKIILTILAIFLVACAPQTAPQSNQTPVICTLEYMPYCGVDGITYGNKCMIDAAKIEIAYQGECKLENETHSGKLPGAKVSYSNGTISYSIPVSKPTPCHEVKTDMLVMESYPVQLRLNINITPPEGDVFCAQVIAEQMVEGAFEIDHKPGAFSAYINGEKTFTPEIS
jgi:hypothetical protein